ncbi:stage III sporulation protein AF [Clostridium botulinum]|uniref:Stage III sporulation protein AF n=3 Tax=Clostridium botulinum TaxID=1491 RepID=A0A9Q1UXQ9_CLOBO|nr:stage III sporulation protein AF [Clostridium botulinum]AEB75932.1 stage III sporulation protein AF, SpoIIIAF [Clostridium botulinum BKT015925]KEH97241.1 stage III sporulation protein AF [Clostridium botulinum D str. 16868]KEI02148.1 stage III sporulation protein AF [Clostridium botulinum C/D str. Sp77]KLU75703.1 stage III sporulation protein AF [Clostridium botulinum V891]KOA74911.1 stage III sporulation protein AF [Clostridium botulinum]
MIQSIRQWVISIATAIFFITAVEMILPNNSIKKYAKFVLGLILITVVINPIIKIFNNDFNVDSYINTATKYIDIKEHKNDYEKYKKGSIDNTVGVFANNLENLCSKKLKEKYPKDDYTVNAIVSYDDGKEKFNISEIRVGVKEKSVQKVKKIVIDSTREVSNEKIIDRDKSKEIVNFLSSTVDVSKDKIKVYKK